MKITTESTETKMTTDTLTTMSKTGLQALLTPKDSVLLLIDHQPFQFANLHSHEPTMVVNNVVGLAKTAKLFGVPTILTTVLEERGGRLIKGIQSVFHGLLPPRDGLRARPARLVRASDINGINEENST